MIAFDVKLGTDIDAMSEEIEFNRLTENDDNHDRNEGEAQSSQTEEMSDLRLLQELAAKQSID